MNLYDLIIGKINQIQDKAKEQEPVTNVSASSVLAAEITLISSVLIAAIMLRKISAILMVVVVLGLFFIMVTAMPIIPGLKKEQNDSINSMTFYVILTLGVLITLFYWGASHV
jgi:energy-converting hydrogenase B subunit G